MMVHKVIKGSLSTEGRVIGLQHLLLWPVVAEAPKHHQASITFLFVWMLTMIQTLQLGCGWEENTK